MAYYSEKKKETIDTKLKIVMQDETDKQNYIVCVTIYIRLQNANDCITCRTPEQRLFACRG